MSPVHDSYGKKGLATSKHRQTMLKLALKNSDWISMSDWESEQEHWTPSRQVLQYHQVSFCAISSGTINILSPVHIFPF